MQRRIAEIHRGEGASTVGILEVTPLVVLESKLLSLQQLLSGLRERPITLINLAVRDQKHGNTDERHANGDNQQKDGL